MKKIICILIMLLFSCGVKVEKKVVYEMKFVFKNDVPTNQIVVDKNKKDITINISDNEMEKVIYNYKYTKNKK